MTPALLKRLPVEYLHCKCARVGFTVEHWTLLETVLDEWGEHSLTTCIHWASLPDHVARICKMLAGTLKEK